MIVMILFINCNWNEGMLPKFERSQLQGVSRPITRLLETVERAKLERNRDDTDKCSYGTEQPTAGRNST